MCVCVCYYTPVPLNLANKQQASNKQQATSKHFSSPFWPLLSLIAPGSLVPRKVWLIGTYLIGRGASAER